jgi:hypothetical protein
MPGPTPTPTITPSPTATIIPFTTVFMPTFSFNSSAGEPNNNCQEAFNILPVVVHQFYPNDTSDWYQFQLESGGNLTVVLTNFVPLAGQLAVYRGSKCGNAVFLESNGDFSGNKSVNLGIQPAGHYFIFVSNDGPLNNVTPYNLQARFISLN